MRIGIDWGGTKIEVIALDDQGGVLVRERMPTPADYRESLQAVCGLVSLVEEKTDETGSVGVGIPGAISADTGIVIRANLAWLTGKPLRTDLADMLNREVRIHNDANCFAVSEATDGAGAGHSVVAGVILGTGCGCGFAFDGVAHHGRLGIGSEFGHIPLPWMTPEEFPGAKCWCGKHNCLETWVSGSGFQRDFMVQYPSEKQLSVQDMLALDTEQSRQFYHQYCDRVARALSVLINIIDPDVIVIGGGMSNIKTLFDDVPPLLGSYVYGDVADTPILPAMHGDSSGVRGAAWLW